MRHSTNLPCCQQRRAVSIIKVILLHLLHRFGRKGSARAREGCGHQPKVRIIVKHFIAHWVFKKKNRMKSVE